MKLPQAAKKSLGQNFLIDKNIINKIINIGNINKYKTIVEIGAGYGNLTTAITAMKPKKIFAIAFSYLNNFEKFLLIIFLLFEKRTLVTFSKFFGFFKLN